MQPPFAHPAWRGRPLVWLLGACVLALALVPLLVPFMLPFVAPDGPLLEGAAGLLTLVLVAAGTDLLWGLAGVPAFAQGLHFGIGALGAALASRQLGPGWSALACGGVAALSLSALTALMLAAPLPQLAGRSAAHGARGHALAHALAGLALAAAFQWFAQSPWVAAGDALAFEPPAALHGAGRRWLYGLSLVAASAGVLLMGRAAASPFARVLQALRDNPVLAEAVGYRGWLYLGIAQALAAALACTAGVLAALWWRSGGVPAAQSFETMLAGALAVAIGGRGTAGAVLGALLLVTARAALQWLLGQAAAAAGAWPALAELLAPAHALFWLALVCFAWAYHAPGGVAGRLRNGQAMDDAPGDPR